jgi:ATP phosphoribosyltransferase regulatory subunit
MASQRPREVQAALGTLRTKMALFGYVPADVPIIQPADLFLTRAGDQILHKLFTFERHGISLALRPEFTTPALHRYIADHLHEKQAVVRWQVAGIIFEDDPSDGSLSFERASSGAECIGLQGIEVEAEIIAMAVKGCQALGQKVVKITLGDARLLRAVLNLHNLDIRTQRFVLSNLFALLDPTRGIEYILTLFDAQFITAEVPISTTDSEQIFRAILETSERGRAMGGRTHQDIARRLVERQRRAAQREQLCATLDLIVKLAHMRAAPSDAVRALTQLGNSSAWSNTLESWQRLVTLLNAYGIDEQDITIEPILARDWEYYSGMMFELYAANGTHIAGGGRYDEFARLIGADVDIPAVGFTYYLDALLLNATPQVTNRNLWGLQSSAGDVDAIRWAQALRQRGIATVLQSSSDSEPVVQMLHMAHEGYIQYAGNDYSFERIDALIQAMNGDEQ